MLWKRARAQPVAPVFSNWLPDELVSSDQCRAAEESNDIAATSLGFRSGGAWTVQAAIKALLTRTHGT